MHTYVFALDHTSRRLLSIIIMMALIIPAITLGQSSENQLPLPGEASSVPVPAGIGSTTPSSLPLDASLLNLLPTSTTSTPVVAVPNIPGYKHSFTAVLTGEAMVPETGSEATGNAVMNVVLGEGWIDFGVNMTGTGSVQSVVLGCAPLGVPHTITVVSLLDVEGATSNNRNPVVSGTIQADDVLVGAVNCDPRIASLPQLIQAMREGLIYVMIETDAYGDGEIRGQLVLGNDAVLPALPPIAGTTTATTSNPTTGTSTATTTNPGTGTTTATSTATSTDSVSDDDDDGRVTSSGGRPRSSSNSGGTGRVLGASTSDTPRCDMIITTHIKPGGMNSPVDVEILQAFLNIFHDADLEITGVYDAATIAAVNAYQVEEHETVLRPWVPYGLPTETTPTGYVYKTTKWSIDSLICGDHVTRPVLP